MLIPKLFLLSLFLGLIGQDEQDSSNCIARDGDAITVRFDAVNGTPLIDFVASAQTLIDVPLDYDERDFSGIMLKTTGVKVLTKKTFWQYFQAILKSRDIVVVPYGNVLFPERTSSGPDTGFFALRRGSGGASGAKPGYIKSQAKVVSQEDLKNFKYDPGIIITTSFSLKHVNCQEAANMLQTYFTDPMLESVRAVSNSNSLVATGFAETLNGIQELITLIDVDRAPGTQELRRIVLKNAAAAEVMPIIQSMLGSLADSNAQPSQARHMPGAGMEPDPAVAADPRTNALLVIATPMLQKRISILVDQLDLQVKPSGKTQVIPLENAFSGELAGVLRQWAEGTAGGPISIVSDVRSNSLLVTASNEQLSEILHLVKQLDMPQQQAAGAAAEKK